MNNDVITKRAVTYSVLAHIKNEGSLANGPLDVFIPLVKKGLYYLNSEKGQHKGANISEIQKVLEEQYGIDFPLPVLKSILQKLAKDINNDNGKVFELYNDGSFWIKNYTFEDYDEQLKESKRSVQELQNAFKKFCNIYDNSGIEDNCIIKFIEKNRLSISQYLTHATVPNGENFTLPALFVNYFKGTPRFYDQIKNIYLGSTLTCILDYEFSETKLKVTLLLDTNFIISLLDLNTPESTHTCKKLLEVCEKIGYKFYILPETLEEIKGLIAYKSNNLDNVIISKCVNKEDIFNACERRKLSKVDLDRICDNLEQELEKHNILIVANTDSLKSKAKYSNEYKLLKTHRNTWKAALHDAMAILYVKETRRKNIRDFEKVNCWFVNNAITHDTDDCDTNSVINTNGNQYQPEIIKVDNLLNILWLSNPTINTVLANNELVDIGLTSLVAFTLDKSLPKAKIIKELDDNIQKYKSQDITDRDVYLLSSRIANNQIKNIESINDLAEKDSAAFNKKIKEEAKKQEKIETDRARRMEELFKNLEAQINGISKQKEEQRQKGKQVQEKIGRKTIEIQTKDDKIKRLIMENDRLKAEKRESFIAAKLKRWRRKSWVLLIIIAIIFLLCIFWVIINCGGNLLEADKVINKILQSKLLSILLTVIIFIIEIFVGKSLYDKYQNHSNIKAYEESIKIPEDLQ